MSLESGTPIGKYIVRRKIAEGGMAEVYLASARGPEGFEKQIVIKRIRSYFASDPSFVQMFIAEARMGSLLNHANLVQIFDFDKHLDSYYLAMEYVHGQSLWDVRKRSRALMLPLPPMLVAQVGLEVARGLHYAHRLTHKGVPLNLVHRDVTPHNVLVSYDGAVKLLDFGVAKAGTRQTAAGMLKGKLAYMSPEQARAEEVDARTDVFALGIVLWEMLTGGRLFDGDNELAVIRAVQQSQIAPPARLNADVPEELDAIVVKALDRDPARRHQTAQELERALATFVLNRATSLEDTDLGAFLRQLFAEELAADAAEASAGGSPAAGSGPPADYRAGGGGTKPFTPVREPTAVQARAQGASGPRPEVSPDDDASGPTLVVRRAGGGGERTAGRKATGEEPVAAPGVATRADRVAVATPAPVTPALAASPSVPARSDVRPRPVRPTIGMRRALSIGLALFLVIGGAAVYVSVSNRGHREAPVPAPVVVATSPVPAPVAPDAGTPAEGVPEGNAATVAALALGAPPPVALAVGELEASSAREEGTLTIKAMPWATVFIDGKRAGEATPRRDFKLPAGNHRVRLEHSKDTRTLDVTIEAGRRTSRDVNFTR